MGLTLNDMPRAAEELKSLRDQKEQAEKILKEINEQLDSKKMEIISCLEENKMTSFSAPCGIKINIREEYTVTQPDSIENEQKLNAWLAENNLDNLRKVNYQTLNSMYRERLEIATEKGEPLFIPGLNAPNRRVTITVRKG